ncbi:GNAT family N-acetyltransferase [Tessaracoccus antarcticus]|uniref:GNAT family N-acetyltransferase n=1 Tax=Tessaracoccus antarcticus TaxID=2479848 RepID=UPI0013145317|nr:GNAT family N-acetyltransferase [Tessaracoccus antarcticus]
MTHPDVPVVIREARAEDQTAVVEICRASGRDAWSPKALIPSETRIVLVATIDDVVLAVAKTHLHEEADDDAPAGHYLGGVVVDPRMRRQGLGSVLTKARMQWIGERSNRAFYFTDERNTASIEMHSQFGFVPIAAALSIRGVSADDEGGNVVLYDALAPLGVRRRIRR